MTTTRACSSHIVISILFLSVLKLSIAFAEDSPENLVQSHSDLQVAASTDRGTYVTAQNVASYRDVLIAPLESWVQDGRIALRIADRLGFSWIYAADWQKNSENVLGKFELTDDGNISAQGSGEGPTFDGFPFGLAANIDQEQDPKRKARMILWNISALASLPRDVLYEGKMNWVGVEAASRSSILRIHRATVREKDKEEVSENSAATTKSSSSIQKLADVSAGGEPTPNQTGTGSQSYLSRENIRFLSPPELASYSLLTLRPWGNTEDRFWIYSPVVGRTRQVFSSNRSDNLFDGLISPEDMFVWSRSLEGIEARVVAEKKIVVPFAAMQTQDIGVEEVSGVTGPDGSGKEESLLTVAGPYAQNGENSFVRWNFESGQFAQLAPWMPTSATFLVRDVWILELVNFDPFSAMGRTVLVVDKESQLPVYALVYGSRGRLQKVVIGGWALIASRQDKLRFPVLGFLLAADSIGGKASTFSTFKVRVLSAKSAFAQTRFADFDPAQLGPGKKVGVSAESKPESTPQSSSRQSMQVED